MPKKYLVRLSDAERDTLNDVIRKLKGSSQKSVEPKFSSRPMPTGRPGPTPQLAAAYGCRTQTVEFIRERFVTDGFDLTLHGKPKAPRPKVLTGEQEAKIIALRLGPPPKGYPNWTLRLLAERAVELELVESVSYETIRLTLKKTRSRVGRYSIG